MQSVLQYRRFRAVVAEQLERHKERADGYSRDGSRQVNGSSAARETWQAAFASDPEKTSAAAATGVNGDVVGQTAQGERRESGDEPEKGQDVHDGPAEEVEVEDFAGDDEGLDGTIVDAGGTTTRPITSTSHAASRTGSRGLGPSLSRASTKTDHTMGTSLGLQLTGVQVRDRTTNEGGDQSRQVFVVGWHDENDPLNPQNWSRWTKVGATSTVASIGFIVGFASSIDSSVVENAATEFGVSTVVESLATGLFLIGFGVGALFAGPISETVGRNPVYIATLSLYMVFIMASALAPNIGSQLVFRFFAGLFGSTPLTCAGGTVADIWNPMERVITFTIFANSAFTGPIIGPVVGGFIAQSTLVSWRWTEWITLILSGLILTFVVLFQPETYSGIILTWKAKHLRDLTGDDRYVAPMAVRDETFFHRIRTALYRPFLLTAREPIIMLLALYLTVIYIILFGFLDGYEFIFGQVHGTTPGQTGLTFLGIAIGLFGATAIAPLIYKWAKRDLAKIQEQGGTKLPPEFRLWYSMLGASIAIPVSLFWMGWTSYPHISIWSPLVASLFFGYGILGVFISCYQYIIDSYEIYSASALASVTFIRYVASGVMVVVGYPFYENLGVQYAVTILACIAALMAPVPYVFFKYGPKIRGWSKYAVAEK